MGRKPKLPRTCGCGPRGGHRKSCPQAKPRAARRRSQNSSGEDNDGGQGEKPWTSIEETHLGRKPKPPRTCGCAARGGHRKSFPRAKPRAARRSQNSSGEDNDGGQGEKPWTSIEDTYLSAIAGRPHIIMQLIVDQLPGRDADAVKRRLSKLGHAGAEDAEAAPRAEATPRADEAAPSLSEATSRAETAPCAATARQALASKFRIVDAEATEAAPSLSKATPRAEAASRAATARQAQADSAMIFGPNDPMFVDDDGRSLLCGGGAMAAACGL